MRKFSIIIYSVIIYLITYSVFEPSDIITKVNNTTSTLILGQYYMDYEVSHEHGKKCALSHTPADYNILLAEYYSKYSDF